MGKGRRNNLERLLRSASERQRYLRNGGAITMGVAKTETIGRSSFEDTPKLLRGILASGGFALFVSGLYEYLSLAGVADSMGAARLVLIFAGSVGFGGVLLSEIVWGGSLRQKCVVTTLTAIFLSVSLWRLDAWTVHYKSNHILSPHGASQGTVQAPEHQQPAIANIPSTTQEPSQTRSKPPVSSQVDKKQLPPFIQIDGNSGEAEIDDNTFSTGNRQAVRVGPRVGKLKINRNMFVPAEDPPKN
jgi:hypothetical protein